MQQSLQQRKRKRSEADQIDSATGDLAIKVIEMQHENDQRLIELEEKRMQFGEKQLEKEAHQQREEREFQLWMMQVMMGQTYVNPTTDFHPGSSSTFGEPQDDSLVHHMHTFPADHSLLTTTSV